MHNLVLFGPPGSGKGTQASLLQKHYGLVHVSTGDVFRREIQGQTPLGKEVSTYLEKGLLVPDALTFQVIAAELQKFLGQSCKGFLFDGFPRTLVQADLLDEHLRTLQTDIHLVLMLHVADDELMQRILLRGQSAGRPDDQDAQVIRQRLEVYRRQTLPLVDRYVHQNKLVEIDGTGAIDQVFQRLCTAINQIVH